MSVRKNEHKDALFGPGIDHNHESCGSGFTYCEDQMSQQRNLKSPTITGKLSPHGKQLKYNDILNSFIHIKLKSINMKHSV